VLDVFIVLQVPLSEVFIVFQVADSEVLITCQRGLLAVESKAWASSLIEATKSAAVDVDEEELTSSCILE
jgi:hypothetical protein